MTPFPMITFGTARSGDIRDAAEQSAAPEEAENAGGPAVPAFAGWMQAVIGGQAVAPPTPPSPRPTEKKASDEAPAGSQNIAALPLKPGMPPAVSGPADGPPGVTGSATQADDMGAGNESKPVWRQGAALGLTAAAAGVTSSDGSRESLAVFSPPFYAQGEERELPPYPGDEIRNEMPERQSASQSAPAVEAEPAGQGQHAANGNVGLNIIEVPAVECDREVFGESRKTGYSKAGAEAVRKEKPAEAGEARADSATIPEKRAVSLGEVRDKPMDSAPPMTEPGKTKASGSVASEGMVEKEMTGLPGVETCLVRQDCRKEADTPTEGPRQAVTSGKGEEVCTSSSPERCAGPDAVLDGSKEETCRKVTESGVPSANRKSNGREAGPHQGDGNAAPAAFHCSGPREVPGEPHEMLQGRGTEPQPRGQDHPAGPELHLMKKGDKSSVEVSVHPKGMGKLDIEVHVEKGLINARISASENHGKEMIERNLHAMVETLAMDRIHIGGFSVCLRDRREEMKSVFGEEDRPDNGLTGGGHIAPVRRYEGMVNIFV